MQALMQFAESWWALYAIHMIELSVFIALIWAIDRWVRLDTRLRYFLWLLPLVKAFVPPFYAWPMPYGIAASLEPLAGTLEGTPFVFLPEETIDPATFFEPSQDLPFSVWILGFWLLSACIVFGAAIWRNQMLWRSLRFACSVRDVDVLNELLEGTRLRVFVKQGAHSPLLVGLIRPRLYLPEDWQAWPQDQLRSVVAHELAHYHHRDLWVLWVQVFATILFALNPFIWLLNRKLIYLREVRCDEFALAKAKISPVEYGKFLYSFINKKSYLSALGFNDQPKSLKKRLEHVLNFDEDSQRRVWWQWGVAVCATLVIVPLSMRDVYLDFGDLHLRWVTLNSVEVFEGRTIALHLDTVSDRGQQVIQENHVKIRLIVRDVLQQVQQGGQPLNLYGGITDILQDQINLALGRQWVIQVQLEEILD